MVGTAIFHTDLGPRFPARRWGVPHVCLQRTILDALTRYLGLDVSVGTIALTFDWLLNHAGRLGLGWRGARELGRLLGPDTFGRERP